MKLYCLAAASLMLIGAAVAEEPNLRGVATTFKEQVAEALGNPDDIEMYEWKCNRGACCNDHGPYDALVEYPKCSCPGEFDCDDDEDEGNDYDSGEGEGDYDDSGDEGGDEGHGCAHCYDAYCNDGPYESNSFLAYPKKSKEECDANGCQHIMNECDEDSEDVEMEANPDDIEMYEKTCDREACCHDHGPYDALVEYDKCSCPRKKRFLCGGEHRIPPRPPQPHERGGCAHCYDAYCNDGPYESDSFLAYHKKSRKECDDNGCQHIKNQCEHHHRGPPKPHPKPEPRQPAHPGCAHCYDAYCNDGPYESDSFLAYHKKSRKECDDNGCQHIKNQCEHHHGGHGGFHGHGFGHDREGGHGGEGGQCPDCGTTNLCCY